MKRTVVGMTKIRLAGDFSRVNAITSSRNGGLRETSPAKREIAWRGIEPRVSIFSQATLFLRTNNETRSRDDAKLDSFYASCRNI